MMVLQITAHFSPNIGGVETHLDDLVNALLRRGWDVFVLTYNPLTTKARWKIFEKRVDKKRESSAAIFRIPWIGGLFYKLLKIPSLEFLYLVPGLFLVTPFILIFKKPDVIHAHGLVAGFVAVFWGKIFGKRVIVSTHSIYNFPKQGFYTSFARWIFKNADFFLGLSSQSAEEIKSLGIPQGKVGVFTYWVDLGKFKAQTSKDKAKIDLGWRDKFVALFVGRLVKEKGVLELLEAAKLWDKNITLAIAGSGPLEEEINHQSSTINRLVFLGKVSQEKLPLYYSAADLLIVPSIHEEGFGRVILESLACGTPVIGAKRGAIPEAMNETVGKIIDVTPKNIKEAVEFFYKNPKELRKRAQNARKFAEERYSERNIEAIIEAYENKS